jgi:hypothetical protein
MTVASMVARCSVSDIAPAMKGFVKCAVSNQLISFFCGQVLYCKRG